MQSNFSFLLQDEDLIAYHAQAERAERLYLFGYFEEELVVIRKISENIASSILDLEYISIDERATFHDKLSKIRYNNKAEKYIIDIFYEIKSKGNTSVHNITTISKSTGLKELQNVFVLLQWFAQKYYMVFTDYIFAEPSQQDTYQANERKLIYIQTADNSDGLSPRYKGLEKIGDATIDNYEIDSRPNSEDLRCMADKRIKSYMGTAGVPYILQWAELAYRQSDKTWFRDYDVHEVLTRSGIEKSEITTGNEWFKTDVETAKNAIRAVKEGRSSLHEPQKESETTTIKLRPEQRDAVDKTKKLFNKSNSKHEMLWNAKMRFGKTISALTLVKEFPFNKVLILTHRPVVKDSWFDDFKKTKMNESGYYYGSKEKGESLNNLATKHDKFLYFASLQDLVGSKVFGGQYEKNQLIITIPWELIIIDEAHEGTQTDLAQNVLKFLKKDTTNILELSGTPFNLLENRDEEQVYTWNYVMEQQAKYKWSREYPNIPNPYRSLPKVSMYTFLLTEKFKQSSFIDVDGKSFNFREFFRVDENDHFIYEEYVKRFLDNITTEDIKTNYPFSTEHYRNSLRHTLWLLPNVKAAKVLKKMLESHPIFGSEYKIVNAVESGDNDEGIASEDDLGRVRAAITKHPSKTKTITLTVRKLTTGVNIPEWTAVIFLSNTTSSMQYLQAAFRAQTPWTDEVLGEKTQCFIFDFAPDRALQIVAKSASINTGAGKLNTSEQRDRMNKILNFMPVIGMSGNVMKPYEVDTLMKQLKRVYAEKAVRSGFDDDSLYSDKLIELNIEELNQFNKLKAIVGTTKAERKPVTIDINKQGLSDEEQKRANKAKRKKRRERTPEEQAAYEKKQELTKQKKVLISILRSISVRIPLMIYGLDIPVTEDITINHFTELVDHESWLEFMPADVSKKLFLSFSKYYDADVFIEAGRIIRQEVKKLDNEDLLARINSIAAIFNAFRNPDKETVLTPWRVVNMHMGETLGGLVCFDDEYQNAIEDGVEIKRWSEPKENIALKKCNPKFLDINAKTGLYPLYLAESLYYQRFNKMNEEKAGRFTAQDQEEIWKDILKNNIYVIAMTPMAKAIATRTLIGYKEYATNIYYIPGLVACLKNSRTINNGVKLVRKTLGEKMKFDVIVGNPPYQSKQKESGGRKEPLYHLFMQLAYKMAPKVTLITPARFLFKAGSTPKDWNIKMLEDKHFKIIMFEKESNNIFPNTDIKGGIIISYRDEEKDFGAIGTFTPYEGLQPIVKKVQAKAQTYLSTIVSSQGSSRFTREILDKKEEIKQATGNGTGPKIVSSMMEKLPTVFLESLPCDGNDYLRIIGRESNSRVIRFIRKDYLQADTLQDVYKVMIPEANGSGALGEKISEPFVAGPGVIATDTFISIGSFATRDEAKNTLKYIKTKFARTLLSVLKATQHNPKNTWDIVPLENFKSDSDIDWSKTIKEIDYQLYKKYNLSDKDIQFIEANADEME
ncbi:MAG: Eco57I restriction-modification methylase domain-containing protein [Selenomonas sp.]|uniref:Eco57I restriction-modification methylase domain-containing protein n=1 Tax=Selenomonas sp. TaxID=2053611 RepID=UPI00260022F4|nr:Eco57I restriction-modification methylase domain-containing protein [Selenomonas sp.]MCR5438129.1 Eco57I restriction-modification methylase domain-containing protein [Selenomonas sp.]